MIPALLCALFSTFPAEPALPLAEPATDSLAYRFQGQFALLEGSPKGPRVALAFRELNGYKGRLIVYSLESGGHFADVSAELDHVDFGRRIAALADLDGDGIEDLALSSRRDLKPVAPGLVEIYSGASGERLASLDPELDELEFGEFLARVPDLDGDGKEDFVVGTGILSPIQRGTFAAYAIYSGRTRERIGRISSEVPAGRMQETLTILPGAGGHVWAAHALGRTVLRLDLSSRVVSASFAEELDADSRAISSLASLGDLDGDGCEELLLVESAAGKHVWKELDGKTWKPREPRKGVAEVAGQLSWIARTSDLDGDGVRDLLACRTYSADACMYAFSGKTLACLKTFAAPEDSKPFFGSQCALLQLKDGSTAALVSNAAPKGNEGKRGVFLFDWQKGAVLRSFGRP